jgi:hypothetical protein
MRYLLIVLILASLAFNYQDCAAEDTPRVYTNDDLNRKSPADVRDSDRRRPMTETKTNKSHKSASSYDAVNKEKWCKKATGLQNRVDSARKDLEAAKKKKQDAETVNSRKKRAKYAADAGKKVAHAQKTLDYSEKKLSDLEQEAHRKGVPPGWLKCQFSY